MSPAPSDTLPPLQARGPSLGRRLWNTAMIGGCYLSTGLIVLPLGLIVINLLHKGLPGLNLAFFFHMPKPVGEPGGGMANAIVGTLLLVGLGSLIAVPVGVGAGLYLAEYGRGRFATLVGSTAEVLGVFPWMWLGVATSGWWVGRLKHFSALRAGGGLGWMMWPPCIGYPEG